MSTSKPTVYIWWGQNTKPTTPIHTIAYAIPKYPKTGFLENVETIWLIIPKPGRINMYTSGWPKIQNKSENMKDFIISGPKDHNFRGFVNLQGIESPGVTSSLAIGKYVGNLVL